MNFLDFLLMLLEAKKKTFHKSNSLATALSAHAQQTNVDERARATAQNR